MKYVERLSKGNYLPSKISKIISDANKALLGNFEKDDFLRDIYKNFYKLIRFGKKALTSISTESEFEKFMLNFEQIFKNLEIEKLHNNTARNKLSQFNKLSLFNQFLYISIPLNARKNLDFIKGGICYNWAIFFFNLFSYMDTTGKLEKELLSFYLPFSHGVFKVNFKNKGYIVDPYAKENGLLTEIKIGEKIYLGSLNGKFIYGKVIGLNPLVLDFNKKLYPKIFSNPIDLVETIPITNELINIKTYLNGSPIHLLIKHNDTHIFINYNGQQLYREKEFSLIDVVGLFMEKKNFDKLDILLALLGLNKDSLHEKELTKLTILASKIDWEFVFRKLGIEEDIKMFI